ncbi:hypothetical protein ACOMHN_029268 [Nucella lapillus]
MPLQLPQTTPLYATTTSPNYNSLCHYNCPKLHLYSHYNCPKLHLYSHYNCPKLQLSMPLQLPQTTTLYATTTAPNYNSLCHYLTYLTYASGSAREQRATTALLQRTRFWEILFSSAHVIPAAFTSASVLLRQVCLGLPTFLFPWGFQSNACRVTFEGGLRIVWPIHPHFLFLMSSPIGVCFVLVHRSSFEMTSGHLMLRMLRRHLLMNVCSFFLFVLVVRHVSEPYSRTDLKFVLKILIL